MNARPTTITRLTGLAASGVVSVGLSLVPVPVISASVTAAPASVVATTDPPAGPQTILGGWITFAPGAGWSVEQAASQLDRHRRDVDEAVAGLPALQSLLLLRSKGSEIRLIRELAYLDVANEQTWRRDIGALYTGSLDPPDHVDTIEAPHGTITRTFYTTDTDTKLVASTTFDDQYLAVVATLAAGLSEEELAAADETLGSITLDPDVRLPQLLQFHGGFAWLDVGGQRTVEIDFDLPSTWRVAIPPATTTRPAPAVGYLSPDDTAAFDLTFLDDDGSTAEERLAVITITRLGPESVLQNIVDVDVSGTTFTMAVVTNVGEPPNADGMGAVLIGDAGDIDIEIVMRSTTAHPDHGRLFAAIVESLAMRTAQPAADG